MTDRIYYYFDPNDFKRWTSAVLRIMRFVKSQENDLPRYGAIDYKNMVSRVISTQDFGRRLPALSKSYADWKKSHGFPLRIGILKFDLLSNIITRKEKDGWYSGVHPEARDSGGKNWSLRGPSKRIVQSAIWLEEGRGRTPTSGPQPARPIFIPTAKRYKKEGWLKRHEVARRRLMSKWR
jgi:hypothetical protein